MTKKQRSRALGVAVTVVLALGVFILAPQQLPVTLVKLSLATIAAVTGFWLDHVLFPYAEPDDLLERADNECDEDVRIALLDSFDTACLRRTLIVSAVVIGICLGL